MFQLEELEAIKRLKYKYLRCIDCKLWDELREVFADDAVAAYDKGRYSANGLERAPKVATQPTQDRSTSRSTVTHQPW